VADRPDSKLALGSVSEKLKPGKIAEPRTPRKRLDPFVRLRLHEHLARSHDLREKSRCLLPLSLSRDAGEGKGPEVEFRPDPPDGGHCAQTREPNRVAKRKRIW
jgi:hypothetical protein